MNILFVTEDHSKNNYGITSVVSQLADELVTFDDTIRVVIVTTALNPVLQHENIIVEIVPPIKFGTFWGWNPMLKKRLGDLVVKHHIDMIHIHGIWMAVQLMALSVAKQSKIPCLVSAHGMLEPWLWNRQGLINKYKKKIYFKLLFPNKNVKKTTFHAITKLEEKNIHDLLPEAKTIVLPNAINVSVNLMKFNSISTLQKNIVFLGRLHPKKGIELLIEAFAVANLTTPWKLIIAGPKSSMQYVNKLELLVSSLKISNRVEFVGSVYGDAKTALLRDAWVMAAPSYSEVVGVVNLEAAMCKLPSITTYETGLWDWEQGGGILIHPAVRDLKIALCEAVQWSVDERLLRGEKSLQLVREKYSWETVIPQWLASYSGIFKELN